MFYDGDLQSGISLALRETKRVICFVRDDGAESRTWEDEYLADEEISELVASKSIALRLASGSQEVGFLSSFCPINKVPTIVVINNGVLQEYIVSGTGEDELKRRLKASLGEEAGNDISSEQTSQSESQPSQTPRPQNTTHIPPTNSPAPEPGPTEEGNGAEELRKKKIRDGKRRAENVESPQQPNEDPKRMQQNWRNQQRKREKQEKDERERILAQIRHDKEERKVQEEQRKLLQTPKENNATQEPKQQPKKPPKTPSSEFRLQVRVFDGSSMRSSFLPSDTVRGNVRPWVDQQRTDGDAPYTFKHILNPHPNRTISVTEEEQTLDDLGLGPTASLVMVPVQTYTEAYVSTSSLPVRGLSAGYSLVASTVGSVAGALGTFLGIGQVPPSGSSQPASQSETPDSSSAGTGQRTTNSNVRTLHDHHADRGNRQLYNGNQLNFEPQRDQDKRD